MLVQEDQQSNWQKNTWRHSAQNRFNGYIAIMYLILKHLDMILMNIMMNLYIAKWMKMKPNQKT